jgi:hypothetical protein
MSFPNPMSMTSVVVTTDLHSVMIALRGVVGEQGWSHGLQDSSSKLDLIRVLRSATDPQADIGIEDAVNLIVKLSMVDEAAGRATIEHYSEAGLSEAHMTTKDFHAILSGMATMNPSSTDTHKLEVEQDLDSLHDVPDTEMSVGSFLGVLETVFAETPTATEP